MVPRSVVGATRKADSTRPVTCVLNKGALLEFAVGARQG